jgi:uncharacterized membrane protein
MRRRMSKPDRYEEIRDTIQAFSEECRAHGTMGYAMKAGYLEAMIQSLLGQISDQRLDTELRLLRDFTRDQAHQRTLAALKS